MARIIGESDCIETIRYKLLRFGIEDTYSFDVLRSFKENYNKILEKEGVDKEPELKSFLNNYKQLYFGAIGEDRVIKTLRLLPDTYYVLNEIQIRLTKSVLWKKYF